MIYKQKVYTGMTGGMSGKNTAQILESIGLNEALTFRIDTVKIHNSMELQLIGMDGMSQFIAGEIKVDHSKKKVTVYLNDESTTHPVKGSSKEKTDILSSFS